MAWRRVGGWMMRSLNNNNNRAFQVRWMSGGQDPVALRKRSTLYYLASLGVLVVGASYAAVPLYRIFCQSYSYGGTTGTADKDLDLSQMEKKRKKITIRFNADRSSSMQWNFRPEQAEIIVSPGETALAFYRAENKTSLPVDGISTYNVIPFEAGQYFNKIQCFCFEEQRLNPGETVELPVFFYIDPEFTSDPKMESIDLITLSYTFFESKELPNLNIPQWITHGKKRTSPSYNLNVYAVAWIVLEMMEECRQGPSVPEDFSLWTWTLLAIYSIGLVLRHDVVWGDKAVQLIQALRAGCPRQRNLFRSQRSPNGDSPTESFGGVVRNAGFVAKEYVVETKDGYLLSLHRISGGGGVRRRYPVLLMHGLLSSPFDFVLQDSHNALAYKLVSEGFDVFLGANRGTTLSTRVDEKQRSSPGYWKFSHIEMGKYDVPALLEKVTEVTGVAQSLYVGYSLGSKQFFSWTAEWPGNCSARVKAMWALAPVAYVKDLRSVPLRVLSAIFGRVGTKEIMKEMEFHPSHPHIRKATAALCALKGLGCPTCQHLLYVLGGRGSTQVDARWQSVQMGHVPDSTSNWNLIHQCQEVHNGRFGYLDKGPQGNLLSYGVPSPPQLDLGRLKTNPDCHVHLLHSSNDYLASSKDIQRLERLLGGALKSSTSVGDPRFNHYDFIWGSLSSAQVYDPLISQMQRYSS